MHTTVLMPRVAVSVPSDSLVHFVCAQSRPILCDRMDCRAPGSSVHGIFLARRLEWVAISFSTVHFKYICYLICELYFNNVCFLKKEKSPVNSFPAMCSAWSPLPVSLLVLEGFLGPGSAQLPPALGASVVLDKRHLQGIRRQPHRFQGLTLGPKVKAAKL